MSDYGSGAGSSFRSGSVAKPLELQNARPGEDDLDESLSWTTGLFGVLYTTSKERTHMRWPMVVFRLTFDFLQLFLLVVNPIYGWDIPADSGGWKFASFISLNWIVSAMGYPAFLACLYLMVIALMAVVVVSIWVAHAFRTSSFDYVWPIVFLRWYGQIFFQVLDIASMSLLLVALDCTYMSGNGGQQGYNQEFPEVACWTGGHMIHAGVAAASLVVFVGCAMIFQLAEIELNPLSKMPLAIGHSKVELQGFIIKVLMTFTGVFLNNPKLAAISYLVCSLILVGLYAKWIPHLNAWVNYVRTGSYGAILYASVLLMVLAFTGNSSGPALTLALWVGLFPAGLAGAWLAHLRTKYYLVTVLSRLRDPNPDVKPHNVFRVDDAREIEILIRCCRVWTPTDEDTPEPEAVDMAQIVIKHGLSQLPKDPYIIILYSSFLIDVQNSYQSGYAQLQGAKKAEPSLLERFAIFSREQQHAQQSAGSGGPGAGAEVNLVSFVEYQKNLRLVVRVHRDALIALKVFWSLLMHSEASLQALMQAVRGIDLAIRNADVTYKMVMARHSSKVKIVRLYARFLEDVKQDPWSAARWFTEAERLDLAEEEAKNTNMFGELGIQSMHGLGDNLAHLAELVDMKGGILGRQDARAMFIINAQCIIQLASPAVQAMFGWSAAEVKGKNINIIIPPPWAEHHNSFVRSYVATGHENVLGRNIEFVALHKDRYTFAVNLSVAKISGMGEDMLFMGLLEMVPPQPHTATAWVMMGSEALVSVDRAFTDQYGHKPEDLLGEGWAAWIVDPQPLHEALASLKHSKLSTRTSAFSKPHASHHDSTLQKHMALGEKVEVKDSVRLKVQIKHRWAAPVTTHVTVWTGGVGTHPFYVMKFELPKTPTHLMVADKTGRLLHATDSVALALGTNAKALLANGMPGALQALMPQPFAALHDPGLGFALKLDLPGAPPLHSCRTGLSVLLSVQGREGPPTYQPFRLRVTKKYEPGGGPGEALQVMQMKQTTIDEALAERRVRLVVSHLGQVQHVLSGTAHVFGFEPKLLNGLMLNEILPGFKGQGATTTSSGGVKSLMQPSTFNLLTGAGDDVDVRGMPELMALEQEVDSYVPGHLQTLVATVASRALEMPEVSWRVDVLPPQDGGATMDLRLTLQSQIAGAAAAAQPAMMAVTVKSRHETGKNIQVFWHETADDQEQEEEPADDEAPGGDNAKEDSAIQAALAESNGTFCLVVDLWRADLTASILEVAEDGVIAHGNCMPLYPPGLVFGLSAVKVVGQHIRSLLPMPVDGNPAYFFQPVLRPEDQTQEAPVRKRTNLKMSNPKKVPGPINTYTTLHQTDLGVLEVDVQAVHRKSGARPAGVYLLVRPRLPACGPADMHASLKATRRPSTMHAISGFQPGNTTTGKRRSLLMSELADDAAQGLLTALQPTRKATVESLSASPTRKPTAELAGVVKAAAFLDTPSVLTKDMVQKPSLDEPQLAVIGSMNSRGGGGGSSVRPTPPDDFKTGVAPRGRLLGEDSQAGQAKGVLWGDDDGHASDTSPQHGQPSRTMQWVLANGGVPKAGAEERPMLAWQPRAADGGSDNGSATRDDGETDMREPGSVRLMQESERDDHTEGSKSAKEDVADAEALQHSTDYRRGQRFKKLLRLLCNPVVQAPLDRFKLHAYLMIVIIIALNLGFFILQYSLLTSLKAGVSDLNSVGMAGRVVAKITHSMREMDLLLNGRGLARLTPGLTSINDLPGRIQELQKHIKEAEVLHAGVYLGFEKRRQLPTDYGLRALWDGQTQNETIYLDTTPKMTVTTQNTSLWEAGNAYLANADRVRALGESFFRNNSYLFNWSAVQYVVNNGPNLMVPGYYATMDGFLQLVIQQSKSIDAIQLLVVIIQGVILPALAFIYMWALSTSVTRLQFRIYQAFIMVPIGLVRQLATRPIVLDEEGEEEEDDGALPGMPGANDPVPEANTVTVVKGTSLAVQLTPGFSDRGGLDDLPDYDSSLMQRTAQWFRRTGSMMAFWKTGQTVGTGRRKLKSTQRIALRLTWPYAVCALTSIIINAIAYQDLGSADSRIALFNIVNFSANRLQRVYYYAQELCAADDPVYKEAIRKILNPRFATWAYEYNAMLFGHDAVANDPAPRFQLAKEGVIYSGGEGVNILFFTHDCLRVNQSSCLAEDDEHYYVVRNGLDRLVRAYQKLVISMYSSAPGPQPSLDSAEYEFLWRTKPDIEDGFDSLAAVFNKYVMETYASVEQLYILALALTVTCFAIYFLFVLRPFLSQCKSDRRRIAELLSQLPSEVSVDEILVKSLQLDKTQLAATATAGGNNSGHGMGSMRG